MTALWIAIFLGMLPQFAAAAQDADFNLSEPAAGVFVHAGRQLPMDVPGHDDIANVGFVVGKKCVAVIDTGGSVRTGRLLRAAVSAHTPLPICYVINTHVHVDHVLGNAAFKDDHPSFVGSTALRAAMAGSAQFFVRQYADDLDAPPSADQVIGPDRLVDGDLRLDLGHRTLLLRSWRPAHTDCDLTVYDVRTRTLWTGDLLFRGRLPALDGSAKGWLSVLDILQNLPAKIAVPGHGAISRNIRAALVPQRRYLHALIDGVRSELKQGKPVEDAIANVAMTEKSAWPLWDSVHPHNVVRAYQELAWE